MPVIEEKIHLPRGFWDKGAFLGSYIQGSSVIIRIDTSTKREEHTTKTQKLDNWIKKYRGIVQLPPHETRESIKADFLKQKYGQ